MFIKKKELRQLSEDIRKLIDGQYVDIRDNREGLLSILKNDIYTLADIKNESLDVIQNEKETLKNNLADISHQLKTPLTGMLLMVDLLENSDDDYAWKAELLSNLRSELTKTEWLVTTLLRIAKLDAGAVKLNSEKNSLIEIADTAVNSVQILLELKCQSVKISANTDVFTYCDRLWTIEALTNIIKNGGEHSPAGSELKIEIGENPICAWLSVTDCGDGVKNARNIFRRWSSSGSGINSGSSSGSGINPGSGSSSFSPNSATGYGLGLPFALRIMQLQSGDITVEGNVFTMKFYK
ncbi:MAG: HAMP domain-containing histidine kinase [Ruminococcus sp.]|jgi:signal transduction histidine kinase|nr:HAMP domain-containing histidine kinase [Ruminococcus sp.]